MENSIHPIFAILIIGALAWVAVTAYQLEIEKARKMLFREASKQGMNLVHARPLPFGGPYWWRRGKGQVAFAIQSRTSRGELQEGYALCGNLLLGLWIEEVSFSF